jgi:hypothetical protein
MNYKIIVIPKSDFYLARKLYQLDWSHFQFAARFVSPIIDVVRQAGFQRIKQFLFAAQGENQTPHLQARVEQTRGSFCFFFSVTPSYDPFQIVICRDIVVTVYVLRLVSLILLRECHFESFFGLVYDADSSYAQNLYFDIRRVCIINLKKKIASYCNVVIRCDSCRPNLTKFS